MTDAATKEKEATLQPRGSIAAMRWVRHVGAGARCHAVALGDSVRGGPRTSVLLDGGRQPSVASARRWLRRQRYVLSLLPKVSKKVSPMTDIVRK
jgi:hypothetical protein